jgi:hypothetical protein
VGSDGVLDAALGCRRHAHALIASLNPPPLPVPPLPSCTSVPGTAAAKLDAVMADALPHLFSRDPQLLHKLVTMLSPSQLAARGVPVCRAVHRAGSFIVTFPDAYHAG